MHAQRNDVIAAVDRDVRANKKAALRRIAATPFYGLTNSLVVFVYKMQLNIFALVTIVSATLSAGRGKWSFGMTYYTET